MFVCSAGGWSFSFRVRRMYFGPSSFLASLPSFFAAASTGNGGRTPSLGSSARARDAAREASTQAIPQQQVRKQRNQTRLEECMERASGLEESVCTVNIWLGRGLGLGLGRRRT